MAKTSSEYISSFLFIQYDFDMDINTIKTAVRISIYRQQKLVQSFYNFARLIQFLQYNVLKIFAFKKRNTKKKQSQSVTNSVTIDCGEI